MNNGQQYIDARKEAIEREKTACNNAKKFHNVGNFLNQFGRAFFGICGGLLLVGGMPGVGVAFLSTAVANHLSLKNRGKIENNKLELLKKEEDHIAKVLKEPINGSREMTAKRMRKVRELEARKEDTSSKKNWSNFTHGLSTLFQWGALAAAVCVPAVGWVSALALGAKYLTGKSKIENSKADDMLALRINNLNLDLDLTSAQQPSQRAAAETIDETQVSDKNNTASKEKQAVNPADERIVDAYISALENMSEVTKNKQYKK